MKKSVRAKSQKNKIWYKLIQLHSIRTLETINVGVVYVSDEKYQSITIKMFDDIGYIEKAFPMFKNEYITTCKHILNIKLQLEKINDEEMRLTRNINVSETRFYVSYSEDIMEEIFNKFITIETTKQYFLPFYKKYKELFNEDYILKTNRLKKLFQRYREEEIVETKLIGLKSNNQEVWEILKKKKVRNRT